MVRGTHPTLTFSRFQTTIRIINGAWDAPYARFSKTIFHTEELQSKIQYNRLTQ